MMKGGSAIPLKNSIASRMLLIILGLYLVLTAVVTTSQIWSDYKYQRANIIKDLEDIEEAFENGLAICIWNLDEPALEASLEGMLRIPTLVGAKVVNTDGAPIAIGGIVSHKNQIGKIEFHVDLSGHLEDHTIEESDIYKGEVFEHRFPITYNHEGTDEVLAHATIFSNSSVIYRRLKLQVALLLTTALLTAFFFAIALLWAVNKYLRKPLEILTSATVGISPDTLGSFSVDTKTTRRNEIKVLEEAMISMVGNLHSAMKKREESERKFRNISEELTATNEELTSMSDKLATQYNKLTRAYDDLNESQENLKTRERLHKSYIENAPDGIFVADEKGYYVDVNPAACMITGYSRDELIGMHLGEMLPKEVRSSASANFKALQESGRSHGESAFIRKDGSRNFWTVDAVKLSETRLLGFARDITQRKHLESQLRQTQKMEAIGTLAGGIAHDFNNVLFAILGNADLAEDLISDDNPAKQNLKEIVIAGNRATALVKQILTFARKSKKLAVHLEVSSVVKEVVKMLRATLPTTIEIIYQQNTCKSQIHADPTEIHQVIMNLITNAGQAMLETGGSLDINLDATTISESDIQQHPTLQPGEYLIMSISDTGTGMTPEIQERIFEPFFTTKFVGQGTGMGLAVVHGIIQDMGGAIYVFSEIGQGTTFSVFFPLATIGHATDHHQTSELLQGTESILVVDDESAIVNIITAMLRDLGYTVEAHTSSTDALAAYTESPESYDVILSDQTMPVLTGVEFAKKVLENNPQQPFILTSGFSHTASKEIASEMGISSYISKPISKQELAKTVRAVLR